MANTATIDVRGRDAVSALRGFFASVLTEGGLEALLVAQRLGFKNTVMPTLTTDPDKLAGADPLAPAFPVNAARMVAKLTRKPFAGTVAVVLRPCEIRAFIELVKLKQGSLENVLVIGLDCLGAYGNVDYARFAAQGGADSTAAFYRRVLSGGGSAVEDFDLSPACKACGHFVAEQGDLLIGLLGMNPDEALLVKAQTAAGEELLAKLNLPAAAEPEQRKAAISELSAKRAAYRERMFAETSEATSDLEKLADYLSGCVNCYNCRVACPVCYCRECVFTTDVFDHEPSRYLRWAKKKGLLKMPADTVFYHLTRLAHMSTACIGCGQCSNACPNNVPVMELFRTVAAHTQRAFNYEAGRSVEEEPPLATFREKEFAEVTGGRD